MKLLIIRPLTAGDDRFLIKILKYCFHVIRCIVRAFTVWKKNEITDYSLKLCSCLRVYAGSEGQDQPEDPRSLIRAFARSLITKSFDSTECINGEQRPGWYLTRAHDDLNLRILRMFEDTLSLDATHLLLVLLVVVFWSNIQATEGEQIPLYENTPI